jgi:hypothetical protein
VVSRRFPLLLALAGLTLPACAGDRYTGSPRIIYKARGEQGRLVIADSFVHYRDEIGWDYYDERPARSDLPDRIRYEGVLVYTFVVAGLVEEIQERYALEITARPCRDRRGRLRPTSVVITFSPEIQWRGCGGPMPGAASARQIIEGSV